jgi:hypothetical protein
MIQTKFGQVKIGATFKCSFFKWTKTSPTRARANDVDHSGTTFTAGVAVEVESEKMLIELQPNQNAQPTKEEPMIAAPRIRKQLCQITVGQTFYRHQVGGTPHNKMWDGRVQDEDGTPYAYSGESEFWVPAKENDMQKKFTDLAIGDEFRLETNGMICKKVNGHSFQTGTVDVAASQIPNGMVTVASPPLRTIALSAMRIPSRFMVNDCWYNVARLSTKKFVDAAGSAHELIVGISEQDKKEYLFLSSLLVYIEDDGKVLLSTLKPGDVYVYLGPERFHRVHSNGFLNAVGPDYRLYAHDNNARVTKVG